MSALAKPRAAASVPVIESPVSNASIPWRNPIIHVCHCRVYLLIFRYLRDAPPVTRLVASVGSTIVLQGAAATQVGTGTVRADPILPDRLLVVQGSVLPTDRLWLVGVVLVLGSAIAALSRFTRFGLATRAAAENAKGAILMGESPARLGLGNWLLAAIGMFEGLAVHLVSRRQVPDFLLGGIKSVVPFLAIVVALLVFGRSVPDRGTILDRRFPEAPPAAGRRPPANSCCCRASGCCS